MQKNPPKYRQQNGPTALRRPRSMELHHVREILRLLKESYGSTLAMDSGPRALKAIREHLVTEKLCRYFINPSTGRIKRIFKWGLGEELIPPSTLKALLAVAAIRERVARQVWALVQLTGHGRPGPIRPRSKKPPTTATAAPSSSAPGLRRWSSLS